MSYVLETVICARRCTKNECCPTPYSTGGFTYAAVVVAKRTEGIDLPSESGFFCPDAATNLFSLIFPTFVWLV